MHPTIYLVALALSKAPLVKLLNGFTGLDNFVTDIASPAFTPSPWKSARAHRHCLEAAGTETPFTSPLSQTRTAPAPSHVRAVRSSIFVGVALTMTRAGPKTFP